MRLVWGLMLCLLVPFAAAGDRRLDALFAADSRPVTARDRDTACLTSRERWLVRHAATISLPEAEPICQCREVTALDTAACDAGECYLVPVAGFACTFLGPVDRQTLEYAGRP